MFNLIERVAAAARLMPWSGSALAANLISTGSIVNGGLPVRPDDAPSSSLMQ
jgi:hypothetical protein